MSMFKLGPIILTISDQTHNATKKLKWLTVFDLYFDSLLEVVCKFFSLIVIDIKVFCCFFAYFLYLTVRCFCEENKQIFEL